MGTKTSTWKFVVDSRGLADGMRLTRSETRAAARVLKEVESPLEKFERKTDELGGLLRKGAVDFHQYSAAAEKMAAEFKKTQAELDGTAEAEREREKAMQRGAAVTRQAETATERYTRELKELDSLLDQSAISEATYNRAVEELHRTLPRVAAAEQKRAQALQRATSLVAGAITAEEQYERTQRDLAAALQAGTITETQHNRALEKAAQTLPANIAATERRERAERELQQQMQRGAAITRNNETATERYGREIRELNGLLRVGAIGHGAYSREVKRLGNELLAANAKANSFSGSLMRAGTLLNRAPSQAMAVAGIGYGLARIVGQSEEFDKAMYKSLAITDTVSEQMRQSMELTANQVAANTKFSATEAAGAYEFLFLAGQNAEQALASMPAVAQFAAAGSFDLQLATDLATDSLSALGLAVKDPQQNLTNLRRIMDVMVKGSTIANASAEQLAVSFTNKSAAAARQVGMEVEELGATLLAFADQGTKGEEAGTQFAIVLRDLQTKALANGEAFATAGINVFDAQGEFRNMSLIMKDMERGLDGLSDAAKKQLLLDLGFSDKSVGSLSTLLGTSDKIAEYEAELRNAGGSMAEVADRQLPPLTKALERAKAEWAKFAQVFGTQIKSDMLETTAQTSFWAESLAVVLTMQEKLGQTGRAMGSIFEVFWTQPLKMAQGMALLFFESIAGGLADMANTANEYADYLVPDKMVNGINAMATATTAAMNEFESENASLYYTMNEAQTDMDNLFNFDETAGDKYLKQIDEMNRKFGETGDAAGAAADATAGIKPQPFSREPSSILAEMNEEFDRQIEAIQKNDLAWQVLTASEQGATEVEIDAMLAKRAMLDEMKEQESAISAVESAMKGLQSDEEKLLEFEKQLQIAAEAGAISEAERLQLLQAKREELEKPIDVGGLKLDSMQAGSAAAVALINETLREARFGAIDADLRMGVAPPRQAAAESVQQPARPITPVAEQPEPPRRKVADPNNATSATELLRQIAVNSERMAEHLALIGQTNL